MSQRNFILVQILAAHGLSDENTPAAVKTTCMWRYSYAGRSPATFDFSLFLIIRNYYLINAHKRMTNKLFIRLEAPQKKILIITIIRIYTPRSIYIYLFFCYLQLPLLFEMSTNYEPWWSKRWLLLFCIFQRQTRWNACLILYTF